MIRLITMLSILSVVFCQYAPRHRGPPPREEPIPLEYEDEPPPYRPAPRNVGPPPRNAVVHKPASVHYVNIGEELAGDYKFGYDTGKGNDGQSFREETRLPDGTVRGAYGYVDESGQQRIVKYTAGKDGFKVEGDGASEAVSRAAPSRPAPQPAPRRPEPTYAAPPPPPPPPQPAYRPAPQPQPAYRPAPQPQPAYRPPAPAPQAYRPAPAPQQSYRPPPQAARPAPVEYAPPPQPAYRAPPPPQRPRARPQRPAPREQYAPRDAEPDYDYPENEITERRLVPVDTALFNYNIGTGNEKSQFLSK
ncbi:hypothetical protein AVEN_136656-1 [Araneus ventricosus]|uniref:Cuticle protein 6 n=1 Tax=Araneus ventricosus TaxID=182803 RepID=A0A4Y2C9L2_ARAVE|nr:hypothetical protein AVEN_136656-1 [Araneus ventricosus]